MVQLEGLLHEEDGSDSLSLDVMQESIEMEFPDLEDTEREASSMRPSLWSRIAEPYFSPREFERRDNGKMYRMLGTHHFNRLVMETVGRIRRKTDRGNASNYFIGDRVNPESVTKYERGTRFNELVHAPFFAWNSVDAVNALTSSDTGEAITSGIFAAINLYLVFVQRYNRARVYPYLERKGLK